MKIAIFGGTFDPVHYGHINLAIEMREKRALDEVWFVPVQINPHKLDTNPANMQHRIEMLRLAVEGIKYFKVNDVESRLPYPSYTFNTIQHLVQEKNKEDEYFFILGEDAVNSFLKWHKPKEIIKLVQLLIGSRSGLWEYHNPNIDSEIKEAIQKGLTPTKLMDISSTDVRERLKKGLYCGHLIPASVLEYIERNTLYKPHD